MCLGTGPKAAKGPERGEPVVMADGENPPSASLAPRVFRLVQGRDISEGARVSVCPKGASWFADGAGNVRRDIRRSDSSTYLCSRPNKGRTGKETRTVDGPQEVTSTYVSRINQ